MRNRRSTVPLESDASAAPVLRVAFASPGMGVGGAERWILSLSRNFSAAVKVEGIYTPDVAGPLAKEARRWAPVRHLSALGTAQADVLIAWGFADVPLPLRKFKGPMVYVSHGDANSQWARNACKEASECTPYLTAVSRGAAAAYPQTAWDRVRIIYNGADVERCAPRHGRSATRERLGITKDNLVALFFGRLCSLKRPELMLAALDHLNEGRGSHGNWRGVFCGPDPMNFRATAEQRRDAIVLPPEPYPGDLMAAADVFVLPSETEGHPLALTEAWLAGLPAVYCDWPFAEEVREWHGLDAGQCVPLKVAPEELALSMLNRALHGRESSEQWIRRHAWEHLTSGAMAARWETYLVSVVAEGPARAALGCTQGHLQREGGAN